MSTPILGNLDKRCWGREDELAWLMKRVANDASSITLLYGDSGIGKSTLFKEFHERLRVQGMQALAAEDPLADVATGYWDCGRSLGVDPLLKCLDECLRTRIPDELSLPQQLKGRVKQIVASLSQGSRLRTFLKTLAAGIEQQVGGGTNLLVGHLVAPFLDLAGSSRVSSLTLPRVPADLFHEVLGFFQQAFDHCPMVLILHNLSALPESGQSLRAGSLWEILTTRMGDEEALPKKLHVVIAWKSDPGNRAEFSRLEQELKRLRAYNRFEERRLEPIATPRMSEWLDAKVAWYRNASAADRKRVLQIAAGLPMVVKDGWIQGGINALDIPKLEESAKGVCEDRFPGLTEAIEREESDWETLYQLSIAPAILAPRALAVLTDTHPQAAKNFLDRWTKAGLLENIGPDQWQFDHERKQLHTREVLAQKLFDRGQGAARRLYDFYLQQCGFPDESHPQAPGYCFHATRVAAYANVPQQQVQRLLRALASVGLAPTAGESSLNNAIEIVKGTQYPWAVRFLFWHMLLSKSEPAQSPDKSPTNAQLPALPSSFRPLNAANGLVNASNAYGSQQRWSDLTQTFEALRDLAARHSDSSDVVVAHANALFNASNAYGSQQRWSDLTQTLEALRDLAARHSADSSEVVLAYAKGLANASNAHSAQQRWSDLTQTLEALRDLAARHSDSSEVVLRFANGLFNASNAYGSQQRWSDLTQTLESLRDLAARHSDSSEVALRFAKGLFNASDAYGSKQRWSDLTQTLEALRDLAARHSDSSEIVLEFAKGLFNASNAYRSQQRWSDLTQTLEALRDLATRHSDSSEVVLRFAKGLINACASFAQASPEDGEDRLRGITLQLVALKDRLPDHPEAHSIRALIERIRASLR